MMYLEYLSILIRHLLSKVIGLVHYFLVVEWRDHANNVVFNYVLQNGIYLKRLYERPIKRVSEGWIIGPYHGANGGFISERKVSWLYYQFIYWVVWGWLDADANDDTFDYGRVEELRKESKIWAFFLRGAERKQFGNAFDLGDFRQPNFHFFAAMFWNTRNTAQNFLYMEFQKQDQPFLHTIFGRKWGWDLCEDGKSYQLVYFKK